MVDRPDPGWLSKVGFWCGRHRVWIGVGAAVAAAVVTVVAATYFYAPPGASAPDPALRVQSEVLRWTYGLFVTGLLALLVSSVGLVALYHTFLSQRTLAQDQTRGYVEVILGRVSEHPELGFKYSLDIEAHGSTPVFKIKFQGHVVVSGVGWRGSSAPRTYRMSSSIDQLAPGASWTLTSDACTNDPGSSDGHWIGLDAFRYKDGDGSAARRYGSHIEEEGSNVPSPHLSVSGQVSYEDVYRRPFSIDIHQFLFIDFDGRLRGTGRKAPRFPSDGED
jgi:hypothetical protein